MWYEVIDCKGFLPWLSVFKIMFKKKIYVYKMDFEKTCDHLTRNYLSWVFNNIGLVTNGPIFCSRSKVSSLNFLKEKLLHKLQLWKASALSFVGRTVLVKYMLSLIRNYFMQPMLFHKSNVQFLVGFFTY